METVHRILGAGVVDLAAAREPALRGIKIAHAIATETSSRISEAIHRRQSATSTLRHLTEPAITRETAT